VGTVREDDPRLDVRLVETARQPLRVIIDSRLETPPASRMLDAPGAVLIYAAQADEARAVRLAERGAQIVFCPNAAGKVDLPAVLSDLAQRGINELHVEAGHKLNGSFAREGLVDEFLLYLAPKLMGQGRALADLGPFTAMDQAIELAWHDVAPVGSDLRILARPRNAV
jgi:diaminohydroxyphosphoribosylaminopyrimidine deaminase/5-amino-6-(5-phosphoribosylamino)uracil reductase